MESEEYVNKLTLDTSSFMAALRGAGEGFQAVKLETTAFAQALADLTVEESKAATGARSFSDALAEAKLEEIKLVPVTEDVSTAMRAQATATNEATAAMDELKGVNSAGGRGILGVSYAVQDFTSVMQGGGGFGRAIASVQNNIPPLLEALGMGAGLAGGISLVSVGLGVAIPLLLSFADASKAASEESKKLQDEAKAMLTPTPDEAGKAAKEAFGKYEARGMGLGGAVAEAIKTAADREVATPEEAAQVREHELHGGGFIPEMLGLSISPETLQKRLEDRTKARAGELIAQAGRPGATGKAARAKLKKLAADNPNLFPNDFAQLMGDLDEDPAERQAAEMAIEEEEEAKFPSGAPGRERAKQLNEEEAAAKKRADQIAATYVEDAQINERELKKIEDAKEKARRERAAAAKKAELAAKAAAAKAKHEADAAARAADPSVMAGKEREQLEDRARTMASGMEGPMGWQPSRAQFNAMISQAVGNMPMGGGQDDLAEAINRAAWAGYQKAKADLARQMQRGQVWSETRE